MWYVYILKCSDNTFYTGITIDVGRRLAEHNGSNKGAKYTKARRPLILAYQERKKDRSSAAKREWQIKKMTRKEKEELLRRGGFLENKNVL